jgi:para-aminobenzoate synthetase/4-amino-4-deoxychorismate lyase
MTTFRRVYESAKSSCPGYDDVLLWNERGDITETCIANVVVSLGGEFITTPV